LAVYPDTYPIPGVPLASAVSGTDGPCRVLLLSTETAWCTDFKNLAKHLRFRVKRLDSPIDALVHIHEFDPHLFVINEFRARDLTLVDLCDAVRIPRQLRPLTLLATTRVPIPPGEDLAELGVDEIFDCEQPLDKYSGALVQHFRLTNLQRRVLDRERDILDGLPDALMIVDPELTLLKVNRAFAAMWGLASAEPLRKHLGQPLAVALENSVSASPRDMPGQALSAALELALREGHAGFACRERLNREERALEGQITRLESQDGHILVALRDVTDRQQALLREARRERLATIGNLAVGVAHEIQNPNTFSRVNATNLKALFDGLRPLLTEAANSRGGKIGNFSIADVIARIDEAIAGVDHASHRIGAVLETLKSYGRSTDETVGSADVKSVITEADVFTKHVLRGKAELIVELPEALPSARATASELLQVFINLIQNACEAFGFSGPQARGTGEARIRVYVENMTEDELVLAVSDNGPGIDAATQAQIFRPYFTTRAQGEGTGLGLSISSDILRRAGGDLTVRSRRGDGATFLVTLKRMDAAAAAATP
jgi:signal transduction histidine kinase